MTQRVRMAKLNNNDACVIETMSVSKKLSSLIFSMNPFLKIETSRIRKNWNPCKTVLNFFSCNKILVGTDQQNSGPKTGKDSQYTRSDTIVTMDSGSHRGFEKGICKRKIIGVSYVLDALECYEKGV